MKVKVIYKVIFSENKSRNVERAPITFEAYLSASQ